MGFFFENSSVAGKKTSSKRGGPVPVEYLKKLKCSVCPLNTRCEEDKAPSGTGAKSPMIYIIGEEPPRGGELEVPFSDHIGRILVKLFPKGWFPAKFRVGHITRCSSVANRSREDKLKALTKRIGKIEAATECCRTFLEEDILTTKPKVVIGLGERALKWATGQSKIEYWRGTRIPCKIGDHSFWFYPLLSPKFIKENRRVSKRGDEYDSAWDAVYRRDIQAITDSVLGDHLDDPQVEDPANYFKGIKIYYGKKQKDFESVKMELEALAKEKSVAVDVETTGFRPYGAGQRLLCLSIGTGDKIVALAYDHPQQLWTTSQKRELRKLLIDFFKTKQVKIAHNLNMEQEWLSYHLERSILDASNWGDTMYQAYLLNNNKGGKSLDALCLIHFGMHLKSISDIDTSRCIEYPIEDLLIYNALDVKYTHKLYQKLRESLKKTGIPVSPYKRGVRTIKSLTKIQGNGLCVDLEVVDQFNSNLEAEIKKIQKKIQALPEMKKYSSMYGTFNPGSPDHVKKILTSVYEMKRVSSVDEAVLKELDPDEVPIAPLVLKFRNLNKQKSTYVESYYHLIYPDGKLHTKYSNMFADTGRLSSSDPNLQNIPKRKNKELRRMFVPPPGHHIVAADYGQIEARIIGMLSKDEKFCEALWHNYDVHMDWAVWLAKRYPKIVGGKQFVEDPKILKWLRQEIKNKFVFPSFFGSAAYGISSNLRIPLELAESMQNAFWEEFDGARRWQQTLLKFYEKNGYVETPTGRRFQGPLTKNKIFNFPIQGTAADLIFEAMNQLAEEDFEIVIQIHDDLTFYIEDSVVDSSIERIAEVMTGVDFDFINVPLTVEVEKSSTNWAEMQPVAVYSSEDFNKIRKQGLRN